LEPKRFIDKIFEACITVALSAYLLRLAAQWLREAAPYLITFAAIVFVILIVYRVWKYMRDSGKW